MIKVTVIVEDDSEDGSYRQASREGLSEGAAVLLARCVYHLAEDVEQLRVVADAMHRALNRT